MILMQPATQTMPLEKFIATYLERTTEATYTVSPHEIRGKDGLKRTGLSVLTPEVTIEQIASGYSWVAGVDVTVVDVHIALLQVGFEINYEVHVPGAVVAKWNDVPGLGVFY